jgi:tetraacyldisaccharide 4'-kinase
MSWFRFILYPLSLLYGLVVWIRNKLFDWVLLPSVSYSLPVIGVGNLSTGGTGKTPHVEYLVRLLGTRYRLAVLSRGYKRRSRGLYVVTEESTASQAGDEPLQVKRKFPKVLVVVHESRKKGMAWIMKNHPEVQVVLLDDAFQHRHVRPGLNLLLTEYYHPFFRNVLLPSGTLREPKSSVKRADALIVTKTPEVFSPLDRRFLLESLVPRYKGPILFSTLTYSRWHPVQPGKPPLQESSLKTIFLFTGIANAAALEEHLKTLCQELLVDRFPDHHPFSRSDLKAIRKKYEESISQSKILLTTEKDYMRLRQESLLEVLSGLPVYYVPVEVSFHDPDREVFDTLVGAFVSGFPEPSGRP